MTDTTELRIVPEPGDHRIAWLTALAITIHIAEAALPMPLPGLKPGLANVVTVAVLCLFGWRSAAWVSLLRVLVGSLLLGTFLSPTFMLSLAGALCTVAALGLGVLVPGRGLGPIGYSVLGAMAHMAGQFAVAFLLFIPHPALFALLPVLMTVAVVLGVVNGIIALKVVRGLRGPFS